MRFSYLPTRGPTAMRDGVLVLAREGERLDMHSAMIADHIVFPVESDSIIASDIRSFAAIGVHELILDFRGESLAESITRLQRFAVEVIPLAGEQPCH